MLQKLGKTALASVAALGMIGLGGLMVGSQAYAEGIPYERLAGSTGVETSLAVARYTWGTEWPVVYVASNRNPVDALPAAAIGDGPVVLTDGINLNLGGANVGKIVILGGTGAVPADIEVQAQSLATAGVERLAGADRNMTARAIADRWMQVNGMAKKAYITRNADTGSPDAVAASALRDGPILTFTTDGSMTELMIYLGRMVPGLQEVVALGGEAAVPTGVLNVAVDGPEKSRLAGPNRYATAFEIAKTSGKGRTVYVAAGTALKDAMVAGAAQDGPILLTPPSGEGTFDQILTLGATKIVFVGGEGVLPDSTVAMAAGIRSGSDDGAAADGKGLEFTGTVRYMSLTELADFQNLSLEKAQKMGNPSFDYVILVLDKPTAISASYASDGTGISPETRTASIIGLAVGAKEDILEWKGSDGKHVTVEVAPKALFWPSDVRLPIDAVHADDAIVTDQNA